MILVIYYHYCQTYPILPTYNFIKNKEICLHVIHSMLNESLYYTKKTTIIWFMRDQSRHFPLKDKVEGKSDIANSGF